MAALALLCLPSTAAYAASGHLVVVPRTMPLAARTAVHLQIQMPGDEEEPTLRGEPVDLMQQQPAIVSDETYGVMLSTLLKTNESIAAQISANYALVDYAFLQRLDQAIAEDKDEFKARLMEVKEAVNAEMARRMGEAAQTLKDVLTSPSPIVMDGKIAGFARQGRLDDALLQLLEANLQQAQAAGEQGKGAVAVLTKLQARVQNELDEKLSPPQALLRRLLRMDDKDARLNLLREKMSPKKKQSVILVDSQGQADNKDEDLKPDVDPRTLAQAITELKARFGNVDEDYDTGFVEKLLLVGEEAEAVALDLAGGKELSSRQQQDLMWERQSVSVWDLEAIEEEAHQDGKLAMWEEEAQQQFARQDEAMRKKAIDQDYSK